MKWMTRREAAEYLRVSVETIDRWLNSGKLRYAVIKELRVGHGSPIRIMAEDVYKILPLPKEAA
jgi:excisionase family DNA binding protein